MSILDAASSTGVETSLSINQLMKKFTFLAASIFFLYWPAGLATSEWILDYLRQCRILLLQFKKEFVKTGL